MWTWIVSSLAPPNTSSLGVQWPGTLNKASTLILTLEVEIRIVKVLSFRTMLNGRQMCTIFFSFSFGTSFCLLSFWNGYFFSSKITYYDIKLLWVTISHVSMVIRTINKKNTNLSFNLKFIFSISTKVGTTCTTKDVKKLLFWRFC